MTRSRLLLFLCLFPSAFVGGCHEPGAGSPTAVGTVTLTIGEASPDWAELGDQSVLRVERGLQGALMAVVTLRAIGVEGATDDARADFHGVMADDGSTLIARVGSAQPLARLATGEFEGPSTQLILASSDRGALLARTLDLTVTLFTEGHGLGGGEPTVLHRSFVLGRAPLPEDCVYHDEPETADAPLFFDVTEAVGLDFDPGMAPAEGGCLFSRGDGAMTYCSPEQVAGQVAVGDHDGDGWPDLFLTSPYVGHRLFRNRRDGSFEDRTAGSGLVTNAPTSGAAWLDADGDGDLDLYLATLSGTRHHLFIQGPAGTFTDEALARGAAVDTGLPHAGTSVAVGDYDRDGYLDVYVGEWIEMEYIEASASHSRLLRNLGASNPGHFEDVTVSAGVSVDGVVASTRRPGAFVHTPAFVDLDGDGWLDLALTSDFATSRLFWNQGDGSFVDGTAAAGVGTEGFGMGAAFGDVDADGDLDWFVTSITRLCDIAPVREGNRLYLNQGGRRFERREMEAGVIDGGWGWGAAFLDHDNDADLDLFHTAGWPSEIFRYDPMRFYRNDGAMPFSEVAQELGLNDLGQGRGVATFDYDRDGDLDVLVGRYADTPILYRNDASASNGWLRVRLVGSATNRRGLGARVYVRSSAGATEQLRVMGVGGHFMAQSEAVAHFGLGAGVDPVAEVRVEWPVSGEAQTFTDVPRDQLLVVTEPE